MLGCIWPCPSQSLQNQTAVPAQMNSQSSCIEANREGFPQGNDQAHLHYWQQVLADCRRLRDRAGEGQVLLTLGWMYFFAEDYRAAIDAYQLAEQVDASKGAALNGLGQSYLAVGDHARALDAYKQAVQLAGPAPELRLLQAEAFRGLGLTYLDLKDYSQAIAVLEDALTRLQKHGSPTLGERNWIGIFASLGLAHHRSGHLKEAERYLREALSAAASFVSESESHWDSTREDIQRARMQRFSASKLYQGLVLDAIGSLLAGGPVGAVGAVASVIESPKKLQEAVQAHNQYQDDLRKREQKFLEEAPGTLEWSALWAAVDVEVYVCPLLQEILAAQQQLAEGLELAERCRGRALAQRLGYHLGGDGGTKKNQPLTFAHIQAIANDQQATLVEYTILYEPSRLPPWFPEKESGLLIWGVSPSGHVTQRRVDSAHGARRRRRDTGRARRHDPTSPRCKRARDALRAP